MRRLILAVSLWLVASAGWALEIQDSQGNTPPDVIEVAAGEDVDLIVVGLTDHCETLEEVRQQLSESKAKATYWPRKQAKLKMTLDWSFRPGFTFRSNRPGEYFVAVSSAIQGDLGYDEVHIKVGQGGPTPDPPDPDPGPDPPDPDPPIPGPREVVILHETENRPPPRTTTPLRRYLTASGHKWRWIDQDTVLADGTQPTYLTTTKAEMARLNLTLPVLLVAREGFLLSGEVSAIYSVVELPATGDDAIEHVKDWGG
jgi:hypothetical protein